MYHLQTWDTSKKREMARPWTHCQSNQEASEKRGAHRRRKTTYQETGTDGGFVGAARHKAKTMNWLLVWGMTKTGVEGAEGWRGRTQRRTTLFTSRDGWDSSVGWL
ncbi:hypothetical protein G9C98_007709 [Cotesia typhae]|uniref:Uncharacterized protein n=1 Tax=Cotesia typhae TaxID=2053667 RepID=A0A8J5QJP7_9HYME|nr:hypothetical protein G9C98_007709 [Cotesia typhae]